VRGRDGPYSSLAAVSATEIALLVKNVTTIRDNNPVLIFHGFPGYSASDRKMGIIMPDGLKTRVREYWEKEPCGTGTNITGKYIEGTPDWYRSIEEHRYKVEPFIHSVAQFTRHRGKKILEVGVGAGTDHLQWARAGAECYGVDLTEAAIRATENHLRIIICHQTSPDG
jgi:hypothetical protein